MALCLRRAAIVVAGWFLRVDRGGLPDAIGLGGALRRAALVRSTGWPKPLARLRPVRSESACVVEICGPLRCSGLLSLCSWMIVLCLMRLFLFGFGDYSFWCTLITNLCSVLRSSTYTAPHRRQHPISSWRGQSSPRTRQIWMGRVVASGLCGSWLFNDRDQLKPDAAPRHILAPKYKARLNPAGCGSGH